MAVVRIDANVTATEPMPLIDHHVHGFVTGDLDRSGFESLLSEGTGPRPAGTSMFDSQLGFAVRRWCAPVLGLEPSAPAGSYVERRTELGTAEVSRRLLRAAQVRAWLVDTGYQADQVATPEQLAAASGTPAREIVRLEAVAERVARGGRRRFRRIVLGGAWHRDPRRRRAQVDRRLPARPGLRARPPGRRGRRGGGRAAAARARCRSGSAPGRRGSAPAPDLGRGGHRAAGAVPRRLR
jgi:hypothetical protein